MIFDMSLLHQCVSFVAGLYGRARHAEIKTPDNKLKSLFFNFVLIRDVEAVNFFVKNESRSTVIKEAESEIRMQRDHKMQFRLEPEFLEARNFL